LGAADLAQPFADFDQLMHLRHQQADDYYAAVQARLDDADARRVQRLGHLAGV